MFMLAAHGRSAKSISQFAASRVRVGIAVEEWNDRAKAQDFVSSEQCSESLQLGSVTSTSRNLILHRENAELLAKVTKRKLTELEHSRRQCYEQRRRVDDAVKAVVFNVISSGIDYVCAEQRSSEELAAHGDEVPIPPEPVVKMDLVDDIVD
ncbi:hypothetical protein KIN20_013037 [Parelaphostrongylus tenuis]|uniref:Uncharacterized protein n=1 Tax=Parelaphostrongylus tenuis TaxID=148309 RepID=A0AAD5MCY4_PARTN|nr:hypothetical protein KIN20_013037 [Parelaphostrongylus tenuis]